MNGRIINDISIDHSALSFNDSPSVESVFSEVEPVQNYNGYQVSDINNIHNLEPKLLPKNPLSSVNYGWIQQIDNFGFHKYLTPTDLHIKNPQNYFSCFINKIIEQQIISLLSEKSYELVDIVNEVNCGGQYNPKFIEKTVEKLAVLKGKEYYLRKEILENLDGVHNECIYFFFHGIDPKKGPIDSHIDMPRKNDDRTRLINKEHKRDNNGMQNVFPSRNDNTVNYKRLFNKSHRMNTANKRNMSNLEDRIKRILSVQPLERMAIFDILNEEEPCDWKEMKRVLSIVANLCDDKYHLKAGNHTPKLFSSGKSLRPKSSSKFLNIVKF